MAPRRKSPRGNGGRRTAAGFPSERELIVIAKPESGLRATRDAVASLSGANVSSLNSLLRASGATMLPLFGGEERIKRAMASRLAAAVPADMPDVSTFYAVKADDDKLDRLSEQLLDNNLVDAAYVKPGAEPPLLIRELAEPKREEAPPSTPDFTARQIYLDAAPAGIDARYAWTRPGGKGQGVRIIDIEGAWNFSHEDLLHNQGGVIGGTQSTDLGWRNHGTAVVGEFGGDENSIGVTGICPQANVRAISIFGGPGSAGAIRQAADALNPGDIILIELHRPGPRFNFQSRNDQRGYIAIEWWPDDLAAIVYATTTRGVIVVEAAGNGAENLDDGLYNTRPTGFPVTWRNPFNLANPQSGAVIVGAGAPPPNTHGRNHGADRSRLDFSNFAARVDTQGWGREVTTTGYGDLQGGTNENFWYTDTFSGTSSASPIVVGAIGCMQGALRAGNKPLLTPATARTILRNTGSPQQDESGRPATQRIGNRPNLRQALDQLGIKSLVKDAVKEGSKELGKDKLEIKEKQEKDIRKEFKEKELRKEHKLEIKEKPEKEIRKEFKEKDLFEGKLTDVLRPTAAAEPSMEERLARLESAVHELSHFITIHLRPDLQTSALSQEVDLTAYSQQLEKQAADAKSAKDDKDVEKVREY